jgi:hypothetical protein
MEGGAVGHNFEMDPPKDHPCQRWCNLVQQFRRKSIKCDLYQNMPNLHIRYKSLAGMVLGWVPFKIVSDEPTLHSRWLLLLKIEISSIVHCCFIINQNELKFNCSYMKGTHPRTIPARFGLIWFRGYKGEDLNVKVYDVRRMPSDGKSSHGLWPGELKRNMSLVICCIHSLI